MIADKAYVIKSTGPIGVNKGLLSGKHTAYWTKNGITLFIFEHDGFQVENLNHGGIVEAMPGMIGVDYTFNTLYIILIDGTCEKLCDLRDEGAHEVLRAAEASHAS